MPSSTENILTMNRTRQSRPPHFKLLLLLLLIGLPACDEAPKSVEPIYQTAVNSIDQWLESTRRGALWPAVTMQQSPVAVNLEGGSVGVALFYRVRASDTGQKRAETFFLDVAEHILLNLPNRAEPTGSRPGASLYSGPGGSCWLLLEASRETGESRYRQGALRCIEAIHAALLEDNEPGKGWSQFNDVLFGDAGSGLLLLQAARELDHPQSLLLATAVGDRLLHRSFEDQGGLNWRFRQDREFILPDFSHGAAGIGFFLTSLYQDSGQERFLQAALRAADYLQAVARTEGDVFQVPYGWPVEAWDGYYEVGWAHGMAGTARFFVRLWQATQKDRWLELARACARGIAQAGVPEAPTLGFGDPPFKPDMRFGLASAADFLAQLGLLDKKPEYLDLARRISNYLIGLSKTDPSGMRWVIARPAFMEEPGQDEAFTGLFYGAAGYGIMLLRLDAALQGRVLPTRLPDDPF